jgi:hypothetical protein
MSRPEFEDLPFFERPDLTPYLIHLTKKSKRRSAFENLVRILGDRKIEGSTKSSGFIQGPNPAVCLMDVPFVSLKYILNKANTGRDRPRYEPFGIFITKKYAYENGCRPVLYLSDEEKREMNIPKNEWWRIVRLEVQKDLWISWLHEREWRCKNNLHIPDEPIGVLVKSTKYVSMLNKELDGKFDSIPRCIIPLTVVCQGLPYLK